MGNLISLHLQYTTICIEDDGGEIAGTGYLVGDTVNTVNQWGGSELTWEKPATRAYLVTARHVLGQNASVIGTTDAYGLRYNVRTGDDFVLGRSDFAIQNKPPNWAVHPDTSVDVAVLDVTTWYAAQQGMFARFCPLSELANAVSLAAADCDAGDDVYVLGYPLTLWQGVSNLPIVRKGVLATSPRRPLAKVDGTPLRGFLVDGAILPGSSGSPVISTSTRFFPGDIAGTPSRPLVLGVVAQEWGRGDLARYDATASTVGPPIEGYANLGFAHSATTIIETIAQLGGHDIHDFLRRDHDERWAPQTDIPEWALDHSGSKDSESIDRIMRRLHRDRMRRTGISVEVREWHDAIDIMGPVSAAGQDEQSERDLN